MDIITCYNVNDKVNHKAVSQAPAKGGEACDDIRSSDAYARFRHVGHCFDESIKVTATASKLTAVTSVTQ